MISPSSDSDDTGGYQPLCCWEDLQFFTDEQAKVLDAVFERWQIFCLQGVPLLARRSSRKSADEYAAMREEYLKLPKKRSSTGFHDFPELKRLL